MGEGTALVFILGTHLRACEGPSAPRFKRDALDNPLKACPFAQKLWSVAKW